MFPTVHGNRKKVNRYTKPLSRPNTCPDNKWSTSKVEDLRLHFYSSTPGLAVFHVPWPDFRRDNCDPPSETAVSRPRVFFFPKAVGPRPLVVCGVHVRSKSELGVRHRGRF